MPSPARQVREGRPGFSIGLPVRAKKDRLPADPPAGLSSVPHRRTGAPGRAACHRGPHFSEEPGQQPEPRQQSKQQRRGIPRRFLLSLLLFSSSPSAGQEGPLLYRGPCAAVSRGRQATQRASTGMSMPFRTGRKPVRKARPRLTDLPPMEGRQAPSGVAFSFGYFSLYSGHPALRPSGQLRCSHALPARAWPRKRKVTRAPQAIESLWLCSTNKERRD